jgi:hypothetical protein
MFSLIMSASVMCAPAQAPATVQLKWTVGDVMTYAVQQKTTVDEILLNDVTKKLQVGKNVVTMTLNYTWTVTDVSAQGVATMQKKVTGLKSETQRTVPKADGTSETITDTLDSTKVADLEKMPFLNKPAVTAKIDALGNVLDATSDFGQASVDRFKTELPFRMSLTNKPLTNGLSWTRDFAILLDPKYGGTGEQYPATQTSSLKGVNGNFAVFRVSSKLKSEPKTQNELRPLIPLLWEGDIFFDMTKGRYHACKLTASRELTNHEGEGTKFAYRSEYIESVQEKK